MYPESPSSSNSFSMDSNFLKNSESVIKWFYYFKEVDDREGTDSNTYILVY